MAWSNHCHRVSRAVVLPGPQLRVPCLAVLSAPCTVSLHVPRALLCVPLGMHSAAETLGILFQRFKWFSPGLGFSSFARAVLNPSSALCSCISPCTSLRIRTQAHDPVSALPGEILFAANLHHPPLKKGFTAGSSPCPTPCV